MNAGGASLLDGVAEFIRRYVVLSESQLDLSTLWVVHTHCFDAADATPYLSVTSAEKQCGKTRFLEVLQLLVRKPWLTARVSAAVLSRKVHAEHPTLLLDESDAAFGGPEEYSEALRGLLNSGYRRSGCTSLCVGQGAKISYKDFQTYCPKAIAGIGRLPDTVADRSIPIRLRRKTSRELTARFRNREVKPEASSISIKIAEWAEGNLESLRAARPDSPESLSDRQEEVAEPLLAIADLAGGDWPQRARSALVEVLTGTAAEDGSIRVRLLADIRGVFERESYRDKISSRELVASLLDDETSPWQESCKGKPLTDVALARLLKPFEIAPRTIKLANGKTAKGYLRGNLEDAWGRYLPAVVPVSAIPGSDPSPASPGNVFARQPAVSQPSPPSAVTLANEAISLADTGMVTPVTDQNHVEMVEGEL
jgi:Protein of unknown function (DUF3631)